MRFNRNWFSILTGFLIIYRFVIIGSTVSAQEVEQAMQWDIVTAKSSYYPGEPVLLNIQITNPSDQNAEVWFGSDGLEAFTFAIKDKEGKILQQSKKIDRHGLARSGFVKMPAQQSQVKNVILNQWCSTLLPSRKYTIVCTITPYYIPKEAPSKDKAPPAAQPLRTINIECSFNLIDTDIADLKQIIADLANRSFQPATTLEKIKERSLAREMISFTESSLAIPYQLQLLKDEQYTWRKRDIINSLVRSGTLEATTGLVQIIENPAIYKEDIKPILIEGVYKLREKGKAEIISATEGFVAKHKRPVLAKPVD